MKNRCTKENEKEYGIPKTNVDFKKRKQEKKIRVRRDKLQKGRKMR